MITFTACLSLHDTIPLQSKHSNMSKERKMQSGATQQTGVLLQEYCNTYNSVSYKNKEIFPIKAYAINLQSRTDRRESILHEFTGRAEFDLCIFSAIRHERGAVGLWRSIVQIVTNAKDHSERVILICEDDHHFTSTYNADTFIQSVYSAASLGCQLLLGGIGNMGNLVPVNSNLMWVDWFWSTQFMVIYSTAFDAILRANFNEEADVADAMLSVILSNKLVFSPFISVQHDFGYSDVTNSNNLPGMVSQYFKNAESYINMYRYVIDKYDYWALCNSKATSTVRTENHGHLTPIFVHAINMPNRADRRESILAEFTGKTIFKLNIVNPIKHPIASTSLWRTFVKVVSIENNRNSDYFIFCEDDHFFTDYYSEEMLLESITEAKILNADLLSGGFSWIDRPIKVRRTLFWVRSFTGMQFIVVFKKFYSKILHSDTNESHTLDIYLSTLSDNTFVIYPYISSQREFGYSDVTAENNTEGRIRSLFKHSERKLSILSKVYLYYIHK